MKVKDLMTGGVCSVKPETSVEEVSKQMRKIDTGIIPVCNDKEEILGVITDRDIVIRYLATLSLNKHITERASNDADKALCTDNGADKALFTDNGADKALCTKNPANSQLYPSGTGTCTAGEIMSTNVVTAPSDMDIHDAALLLSHYKIRRLPVTSGNRLVGILSVSDIASRAVMADEAGDIMHALSKH